MTRQSARQRAVCRLVDLVVLLPTAHVPSRVAAFPDRPEPHGGRSEARATHVASISEKEKRSPCRPGASNARFRACGTEN
jgi:hypothetical protein